MPKGPGSSSGAKGIAIHVYLSAEAVDSSRPVEASREGDSLYRLAETPAPPDEEWEFEPGSLVTGELREPSERPALVAVAVA